MTWRIAATRVPTTPKTDEWFWHVDPAQLARDQREGRVTTAQRRRAADGVFELVWKDRT